MFFCNNCGLFFYLNDGIQKYMGPYISQMDDIDEKLDPINHQLEVLSVHDNFQEQLACFENDWEISQNPIIYERLKFLIDGLRARLNSVNFEKIVNAQRSAAATNVAYGTTVGLRDPQSLNASINRGLVQFCAWLELKDSQKEKLAIYDTSTNLEEKVIQYELMMNYYYDLQEEFRGKQKEDARKQRLLARCQYSTKESLPQLIPSLPDDKEELLELKKKLLDRRKEIETLCYSKMNHEKDRISDKIGFMILGVGIILILFFVFVLASLSKMK